MIIIKLLLDGFELDSKRTVDTTEIGLNEQMPEK